MLPESMKAAKVSGAADAKPANRDVKRKLAALLMMARQVDLMCRANLELVAEAGEKLGEPIWQTEIKRSGLDPSEFEWYLRNLSALLCHGAGVPGREAPAPPNKP